MADAPSSPAAPAVNSFDPVEWTRRINELQEENNRLRTETFDLKTSLTKNANDAATARGEVKPLREELRALKETIQKSENLKELGQLRAEVAHLHKTIALKDRLLEERAVASMDRIAELGLRTNRAEGKFQALEATASMMATSRDKANASAVGLLVERDEALAKVADLQGKLGDAQKELQELRSAARAPAKPKTEATAPAPAKS